MCTVTFLPLKEKIFLTSNRDEQTVRGNALQPDIYHHKSGRLLYPKDKQAGGTWIAMHSNGNAMVLLNGAFQKHTRADSYRLSRGLIFLEVLDTTDPLEAFLTGNLNGIEPFTLVFFRKESSQLWDLKWDGAKRHHLELDASVPHIWSSATLYSPATVAMRRNWFDTWLGKLQDPTAKEIRDFHEFAGDGDQRTNIKMNRDGLLQTVSITGISIEPEKSTMHYKDMLTNAETIHEWLFAGQSYTV